MTITSAKRLYNPIKQSLIATSCLLAMAPTTTVRAQNAPAKPQRDLYSDTWVATDELGRTTPTNAEVGAPRAGKFVGMFYFLWLGRHGDAGPFDVSKILAQDPTAINNPQSPLWGPLGIPHHWGEPQFGYYVSDDDWVLRKHAQMLSDAGVDAVFFDVTNQLTYPQSYLALCRVWEQIRHEGGKTPQIAFLTPFWDPSRVTQTLYNDLYKPGLYSDLWFRWEGKPLILADPNLIHAGQASQTERTPGQLGATETYGQSFVATKPFTAVGGSFPTYRTTDASMRLSLYELSQPTKVLATKVFNNVADNAIVMLDTTAPLPPGAYYLEMAQAQGQIGWWSYSGDVYAGGRAFANGTPVEGDRSLSIRYADTANVTALVAQDGATPLHPANAADSAHDIRNFFTFRKPQPDYFVGPTGPEQWGWLEVSPQHAFYKTPNVPEQVTVGVAQNSVDGRLGVLSNPRAPGRSFHNGKEPDAAHQDYTGRNFDEQWQRALKIDPAFVFVTGWNEWIAGRFGADAPFNGAGPVNFVDEFNEEYSRDIEPMKGGHTDDYYYQLVTNIRRYKGARPLPVASGFQTIKIGNNFSQWQAVTPEYRDAVGDTAHRDYHGWSKDLYYKNITGRNDIITAKVACDKQNIYFYAQTKAALTSWNDPNWMQVLIDTDQNAQTGWHGYDFLINQSVLNSHETVVSRWQGDSRHGAWLRLGTVRFVVKGNELQIAVPRALIKQTNLARTAFDFHWLDNVDASGDIADWWSNGESAPDGRFNYRYQNEG